MDIAQAIQLGIGGVTLFLLMQVWTELKDVNKFNRDFMLRIYENQSKAAAQRAVLLEANGIDPNDSGIYRREDLGLPPVER